jgi:2-(1,2-epoxy-1,2-dihydrophenyl)acetyl-CoA isomerase
MSADPRVRLERWGNVAALVLTGRNSTNAMDAQFVRELDESTAEVEQLTEVGDVDVVAIRAEGANFCVGGDLHDFASATDVSVHVASMAEHAHRGIARLFSLPVPVLARHQGAVAGGGVGLLLAADIVVAAESASFTAGYAAAGLSPDGGFSWALPRRIGAARTLELLLTNRRVGARELVELGLARMVPDADVDTEFDALVERVSGLSGTLLRATKRLVRSGATTALAEQLDAEAASIASLAGSEEARAALARFTA